MRLALVGALCAAAGISFFDRTATAFDCGFEFQGQAAETRVAPDRALPRRLRVATFNVHSLETPAGEPALELVAQTLGQVDFAGLQELRGAHLGLDQGAELGRRLGLGWRFAPSERRHWHGHFGNGALSRFEVLAWSAVPLVNTRGKAYRNYLLSEVRLGGGTLRILTTHLDRQADRVPQLERVTQVFLDLESPALLLGDLNTAAGDPGLARLCATPGVVDALAGVAGLEGRLDWIFVRGLALLDRGFIDVGASDHPCLWAELALPAGE